jgi:hypothetical protein
MATYANLELDHYYLIKETESEDITLVQPVLETVKTFLILQIDEVETTVWKKKDDVIFEVIEELTPDQVAEYEDLFEDEDEEWSFDDLEYSSDLAGDDEEDEDEDEEDEEDEEEAEDPIK